MNLPRGIDIAAEGAGADVARLVVDIEKDRTGDPDLQRGIAELVFASGKAAPILHAKCFKRLPGRHQGVPVGETGRRKSRYFDIHFLAAWSIGATADDDVKVVVALFGGGVKIGDDGDIEFLLIDAVRIDATGNVEALHVRLF